VVRWVVLVLFVALVVRVAAVVATPDSGPVGDAVDYDRHAVSIAETGAFPETQFANPGGATAYRPPAYPILLGAAYKVTGHRFRAGRVVGIVLGVITVLLVLLVAEQLVDRRLALWSAGVAAVMPPLVWINGSLLSENLFIPAVLAMVLCAARFRRNRGLWLAAAAGVLLGLVVLTRSNGLVLAVPLAAGLAIGAGSRRLIAPGIALACTAVVMAPWTIRNAAEFDRFLPLGTQSGYTMSGQWNARATAPGPLHTLWLAPRTVAELADPFRKPDIDEGRLDAELRSRAIDFAWNHPAAVLDALITNMLRTFDLGPTGTDVSYGEMGVPADLVNATRISIYAILALSIGGSVLLVTRRTRHQAEPSWRVWLVPGLIFASSALWLGAPRYATPILAFLAIPSAATLEFMHNRWRTAIRPHLN
jgi:4-amino-4-deoxy-L-arabinose transferase-like glycosyltransferase